MNELIGKNSFNYCQHQFKLAIFFSNYNFPSHLCSEFFRTTLFFLFFVEGTSSHYFKVTIWQNSCFSGAAISSEQFLFLRSSFFRTILFFRIDSFFRVKLLLSSHFLRKSSFPGQLLCRNSYFVRSVTLPELLLWEELVPNKDIYSRVAFWLRYFCTASTYWE